MANFARRVQTLAERLAQEGDDSGAGTLMRAAKAIHGCGSQWRLGKCKRGGHVVAACMYCGRAGCDCGALERRRAGPRLDRRIMRVWDRLSWATTWGQVVVTTPPEIRDRYRTRQGLAKLQRITAEVARHLQPDAPGSHVVIHYLGDETPAWAPHGNALIPLPPGVSARVPTERLDSARTLLAELLGVPQQRAQLHYSYRPLRKRRHALRYMERDTIHMHRDTVSDADLYLVMVGLRGFRRGRGFGALADSQWGAFSRSEMVRDGWHRDEEDGDTDAERTERGECSICGDHIEWERRPLSSRVIAAMGEWEPLTAGYWRLVAGPAMEAG